MLKIYKKVFTISEKHVKIFLIKVPNLWVEGE